MSKEELLQKMLKKEIEILKNQIKLVINYCQNGNYGTDYIIRTLQSKKIQMIEEKINNIESY